MKKLAAAALALTLLFAAQAPAHGANASIYTGHDEGDYLTEPTKLVYPPDISGAGYKVVLRKLEWSHFGHPKARATGEITGCPSPQTCFHDDVAAVAKKLTADRIYTRLKLTFGQQQFAIDLPPFEQR